MNPFKNRAIEAVYVIHSPRLTERAAHMKRQLGQFDIPFEFIESYGVETLDDACLKRFYVPEATIPLAKRSCTLKHFDAFRQIAARGHRLALVLEDDVVLAAGFVEELGKMVEEAAGFEPPFTIQIGCANNMYVPRHALVAGQRLYEAQEVRANDAYLISAETARRRLAWLDQHKIHLNGDHLFTFIDRQEKIRIYWSEPTLVEQGSMTGLFPSTLGKDRPLWVQKTRFWWQRLRKKYVYRLFK